jgi:antitoxin ParD1/3/4
MPNLTITLSDALKSFVDDQVAKHGYSTSSAYIQELIRKDRGHQALRSLLLDGASSPLAGVADSGYFQSLRQSIKHARKS